MKTRRKKIFFFFNSAPESCAPQQILFLYLKRNRRSRILLFFFFSRRRRIIGAFTLCSRIEEEEYFLSASFQEKKKKKIFLINAKYSISRKGVVPLVYQKSGGGNSLGRPLTQKRKVGEMIVTESESDGLVEKENPTKKRRTLEPEEEQRLDHNRVQQVKLNE